MTPKEVIGRDTEAAAERDIEIGHQREGMITTSTDPETKEKTGIIVIDGGAIVLGEMTTATGDLIAENGTAVGVLRDLSGEGVTRKATDLGQEMNDPGEAEVPSIAVEGLLQEINAIACTCHS